MKGGKETGRPRHALHFPWRDPVRHIEQRAVFRLDRSADRAGVAGLDVGQAFEEGGLAGAVRADQTQDLAHPYIERDVLESGHGTVSFGKVVYLHESLIHASNVRINSIARN